MMVSGKIKRRMGYLRDQRGIASRYQGEMENWDRHLKNCREFIKGAFHGKKLDSVAVLGSGWLLDVDLAELETRFNKIWLADIAHPPQVRKRVERSKGVELLECDLSGGAVEQAWNYSRQRKQPPVKEFISSLVLDVPTGLQPDAIISLNLLSQLDIILCDYLDRVLPSGDRDLMELRQKIQSFHLEWIGRSPAVLITDTAETGKDRKGREECRPLVHVPLPGAFREESWTWTFDTRGSYRPGRKIRMDVKALEWA